MKVVYPALLIEDGKDTVVYVPDLDAWTFGKGVADAIFMARDRVSLAVAMLEEENAPIPPASSYAEAREKAKKADTEYNLEKATLTMIAADSAWNTKRSMKMVRKNCTIPKYLRDEAEKAGINFSQVLQEALFARLAK